MITQDTMTLFRAILRSHLLRLTANTPQRHTECKLSTLWEGEGGVKDGEHLTLIARSGGSAFHALNTLLGDEALTP